MFKNIKISHTWRKVEVIDKGWSSDTKYYIERHDGQKCVLRVADISQYEAKKQEYDIISQYAKIGFYMSQPLDFGTCEQNKLVYMLLSYVEGIDLRDALPTVSDEQQYALGRRAGTILKQIHAQPLNPKHIPTQSKLPRKIDQLKRYKESEVRVNNDEVALDYISKNLDKMFKHGPTYQHGDFHPGNLIYMPNGDVGVIDFNRYEVGDPYEEFYKLESFGVEVSIPYCIGQIDAYFEDNVPQEFFETLAVYVAHASLFSIKWAEKFGQADIDGMVNRWLQAYDHYNGFLNTVPNWYTKR